MKRDRLLPYIFISPAILMLLLVVLIPVIFIIVLSFCKSNLISTFQFVGFGNYLELFFSDPYFWLVVKNTVIWTISSVALEYCISLGIALLLNRDVPGKKFFRSIILLPWIIPPVTAALIWLTFYDPNNGVFNFLLTKVGLSPRAWLVEQGLVLPSLIAVAVWKYGPFMTVSLLSGLQGIPDELYEAAAVDGATGWKAFRYVTFPLLMPITSVLIILGTIWRAGHFDLVALLTGGGPANASHLLSTYSFNTLNLQLQAGLSAAIALTGVLGLAVFMVIYIKKVRRD
jgi:multiple sugar transport system permease protein